MAAHPHAELMALYAKDAAETDKPWERWECFDPSLKDWRSLGSHPTWSLTIKYRRKPERPWYRVLLFKSTLGQSYSLTADSKYNDDDVYTESALESSPNFVKWLTDRVYYDVE